MSCVVLLVTNQMCSKIIKGSQLLWRNKMSSIKSFFIRIFLQAIEQYETYELRELEKLRIVSKLAGDGA